MRRFGIAGFVFVVLCALTAAALAALKPLPLSARVIQAGEFPGFLALPGQSTTLYKNPKQWVSVDTSLRPAQVAARAARMRREGICRRIEPPARDAGARALGGLSWVMQLRSAAAAGAELAANVHEAASQPQSSYTAFRVSGILGAGGYHLTSSGASGDNVVFADGPFLYFVGFGWTGRPKNRPTRAQLVAAATRLYTRTRGHPPA